MIDINKLLASLKRRSSHIKEFGDDITFVKLEDLDALVEALEKAQSANAAAEKLVRCKGRYHSEQNYRALAALFGVKTPDLPPLEHENVHYADAAEMEIAALRQRIAELESRTVKLPKLKMLEDYLAEVAIEERKQILVGVKLEFHRACVAAGIKWEAE
ncbi:TPA: ead/Ea22-like family protein [Klebsiella aerogenes]|nr:ead/Ea22-like family protein [Klebsiella aerogenes]